MRHPAFFLGFFLLIPCFLQAQTINRENAAEYAANFLYIKTGKSITIDPQSAEVEENLGEPVYYTFNSNNNFVIISAERQFEPVLGYSLKRGLPEEKTKLPPAFNEWMNNLADQIVKVRKEGIQLDKSDESKWKKIEKRKRISGKNKGVSPLLSTTWNQGCGYNGMCPEDNAGPCNHVYTGCVATSQAQTMKYHAHPSSGVGQECYTHSTYGELCADFAGATYEWASMPNNSGNTEVEKLMYHCGVSVHMNYSPGGSGAYMSDMENAFVEYFDYTNNLKEASKYKFELTEWEALMRKECDEGRVLPYSGHGSGGHAFVLDGYDDSGNFHFNWGWGGYADGYYTMGNLNPGGNDYSGSNTAIIGVEPSASFSGLDFSGITSVSCANPVAVDLSTGESVVNTYGNAYIDAFGKEKVYEFTTSYPGRIKIEISNQSDEISVVLLSHQNKDSVLASGTNGLTYNNSTADTYYLVIDVAKAQNATCDLEIICPTHEADLIADNIKAHPGVIETNLSGVKFSATVKNIGNSASAACEMEYYLSENDTLDGSDILLATGSIPSLEKGMQALIDTTATMPVLPDPGYYKLIGLPDASDVVPETVENEYFLGSVIIPDTGSMDCSSAIAIDDNTWYYNNTAINGDSLIDNYSCGTNLTGNEMIYSMTPVNSGKAEIYFSEKHLGKMTLQVLPLCNENANCSGLISIWNTADTLAKTSFMVESDITYYLVVDGENDLSGEFGFKVDMPENCPDDTLMYWTSPERCTGDGPFSMMVGWGYNDYQWYKDGSAITGATSYYYTAETSGEYYAEITENNCTVESNHVQVGYSDAPDTSAIEALTDTLVCGGGYVDLQVTAGSSYDIQWYRDSEEIEGATSQQFSATKTGTYRVDIINNTCHLPSNEIDVFVKEQPTDYGKHIQVGKNNLVYHFPLNDNAEDITGNEYNISTYNWYPIDDYEGNFWQARQFIDASTYTYIYTKFSNPQEFTLSLWFKTIEGDKGALMEFTDNRYSAGGTIDRSLYLADDGKLHFYLNNSGSPVELISSNAYDDNNWHHVTVSVGEHAKMYIKDSETVSDPTVLSLDSFDGYWLYAGHDIPAGASNPPSDAYFQGALDDLRYYDAALDSSEIAFISDQHKLEPALRKDTFCDSGDVHMDFSYTEPGVEYSLLNANSGDTLTAPFLANGDSITIGPLILNTSTDISVLAMDTSSDCSRILSNTFNLDVYPSLDPSVTIYSDVGTEITEGESVMLYSSTTAGGSSPAYDWLINGVSTGNTDTVMTTSSLNDGDSVMLAMVSDYYCANYLNDTSNILKFSVTAPAINEENQLEPKVKVYPNPASSKVIIELRQNYKEVNYKLFDITGKCIMEGQKMDNWSFDINVSALKNGIYLINVQSGKINETRRIQIHH